MKKKPGHLAAVRVGMDKQIGKKIIRSSSGNRNTFRHISEFAGEVLRDLEIRTRRAA